MPCPAAPIASSGQRTNLSGDEARKLLTDLLARLRDGELLLDQERTGALLVMVDLIRELIDAIEATGAEGDVAVEVAGADLPQAADDA